MLLTKSTTSLACYFFWQEACVLIELASKMEQHHGHYLTSYDAITELMHHQPHSLTYERLIQSNILSGILSEPRYVGVQFADGILWSFFKLLRNQQIGE